MGKLIVLRKAVGKDCVLILCRVEGFGYDLLIFIMRKLHVAVVTFKEHYPIVWKHWPAKFRRQAVKEFL